MKQITEVTFKLKNKRVPSNLTDMSYLVDATDLVKARFIAEGQFLTWLFAQGEKYNVTHPDEMVKYYEDKAVFTTKELL